MKLIGISLLLMLVLPCCGDMGPAGDSANQRQMLPSSDLDKADSVEVLLSKGMKVEYYHDTPRSTNPYRTVNLKMDVQVVGSPPAPEGVCETGKSIPVLQVGVYRIDDGQLDEVGSHNLEVGCVSELPLALVPIRYPHQPQGKYLVRVTSVFDHVDGVTVKARGDSLLSDEPPADFLGQACGKGDILSKAGYSYLCDHAVGYFTMHCHFLGDVTCSFGYHPDDRLGTPFCDKSSEYIALHRCRIRCSEEGECPTGLMCDPDGMCHNPEYK